MKIFRLKDTSDTEPELYPHTYKPGEEHTEPARGKVAINISQEAVEVLGTHGAMLSMTKQGPEGHEVYWNACVFTEDGTQIWFGDFDYTEDAEKLQELANKTGQVLFLTPEQPFRFDGLKKSMDSYVYERVKRIDPNA